MSRRETFERARPAGVVLVVDRDLDTGEQTATVKGEVEPELIVRRRAKPLTSTTE